MGAHKHMKRCSISSTMLSKEKPVCKGYIQGLPWWLRGKASACNAGNPGSIPGSERSPGEGNSQPTPVFLTGKSHGWRSLVGYSPWGRKESDTTERLHFHFVSFRLQLARLPCPTSTPGALTIACPLSRRCHPTISSSVVPFSSHL